MEPEAPEPSRALDRRRADDLLRQLAATRNDAFQYKQSLAGDHRRMAALTQQLAAARQELKANRAQLEQVASAAERDRRAAEISIKVARELAARERAKGVASEEKLLAARREVDAIKNSAQMAAGEREQILRRELDAARRDLDRAQQAAADAGARARKYSEIAADQGRALEQQRQGAEGLARDLMVMIREIERLEDEAAGLTRSKAAVLRARNAAEVSLGSARRTLEQERRKFAEVERDLALARQSAATLEAGVKQAAADQAAAVAAGKRAEAAATRAGEALASEREKGGLLARDLEIARRERERAKEELVRLSAAAAQAGVKQAAEQAAAIAAGKRAEAAATRAGEALALEHEKTRSLARDLEIARRERDMAKEELVRLSAMQSGENNQAPAEGHDVATGSTETGGLKARVQRVKASVEREPKARVGKRTSERAKAVARRRAGSAGEAKSLEFRKVEVLNPAPSVRSFTVALPSALLPRRSPARSR